MLYVRKKNRSDRSFKHAKNFWHAFSHTVVMAGVIAGNNGFRLNTGELDSWQGKVLKD